MFKKSGFTLIELLIVIAVLAVLATVVVLVINPAQLLAQSRDSRRLSDLQTLNKALQLAELRDVSLGTTNIVYVSLPSAQANCSNLGLPPLPSGWSYQCSNSTNYRKVDGTGWVPVNFASITIGSPLATLPVDPVNEASTGNYYIYVTGSSYKLTALMESEKYANKMAKDGGPDVGLYEIGTNLDLANFQRGLVGYWKFDEGSGTTTYDSSGNGNTGTWNGTGSHWAAGKVGSWAGIFNGVNDYVNFPGIGLFKTISLWTNIQSGSFMSSNEWNNSTNWFASYTAGAVQFIQNVSPQTPISNSVSTGQWINITVTCSVGLKNMLYVNGRQSDQQTYITSSDCSRLYLGFNHIGTDFFNGLIDDVRIYNRALSAAEISAIYNATK